MLKRMTENTLAVEIEGKGKIRSIFNANIGKDIEREERRKGGASGGIAGARP